MPRGDVCLVDSARNPGLQRNRRGHTIDGRTPRERLAGFLDTWFYAARCLMYRRQRRSHCLTRSRRPPASCRCRRRTHGDGDPVWPAGQPGTGGQPRRPARHAATRGVLAAPGQLVHRPQTPIAGGCHLGSSSRRQVCRRLSGEQLPNRHAASGAGVGLGRGAYTADLSPMLCSGDLRSYGTDCGF